MKIRLANIKVLFYIILIFPFIEPQYIQSNLSMIHRGYVLLRMANIAIMVATVILYHKTYKPSKTLIIIVAFYVWLLVNTLIHGGSISYAFSSIVGSLALCVILDYYLHRDVRGIINALASVLVVYVVINFTCIILYPNGMYTSLNPALGDVSSNWFLGYKNPQIRVILPAVALVMIKNYIRNEYLNLYTVIFMLIGILSAILVDSGTATLGILIFVVGILYFNTFNESKVLSIRNIAFIVLLAFIGIVAFNFQDYFASFFNNVLQRDATLTGRTIIWIRYLEYMAGHSFLGSGILESSEMFGLFGTSHPHNYILYLLLQGGIVGVGIIIHLVVIVSKRQKQYLYSNVSHVLICCIASFLIMGLTESLTESVMLYPVFVLAGNIDRISEEEKHRRHKMTIFGFVMPHLRKNKQGD